MEKLLLEATLEILDLPGLIGLQDFGAAGLTCSGVEMASRGGTGMRLDLDLVPQRAEDLTAYEMMLSESQERMMVVVEKGREDRSSRCSRNGADGGALRRSAGGAAAGGAAQRPAGGPAAQRHPGR